MDPKKRGPNYCFIIYIPNNQPYILYTYTYTNTRMIHNDKRTWREFFLLFSSPFRVPLHSRREDVEAQKVHRKVHRKLRTEQLMRSSVLLFGISFPKTPCCGCFCAACAFFLFSCVCFCCGRAGLSVEIDTTKLQKEENWGFAAL